MQYPPHEFTSIEPQKVLERTIADAKRIGLELAGRVRDYRVLRHPHDIYAQQAAKEWRKNNFRANRWI